MTDNQESPRRNRGGSSPAHVDFALFILGARVGRYTIERRLGAGAMSEVYLAVDESLGRHAAIKILGNKQFGNSTLRERFLREARALARLSHPNLIPIFEAGETNTNPSRPYYAMELLEGGDTHQLLDEQGPLPSDVVAHIGTQAAMGLGEAARAGIIHRDVKPANLGISRHGVLKVTDFGLAKSYSIDKSLTGRGMVVGTADYIAPEQARGEELDERADVYSLGCTLFHLLTGHPPYQASPGPTVKEYLEVMRMHLSNPVANPRTEAPQADPELCDAIVAMMNKDREKRPSFAEIAPRLARIAGRLGGELPRLTRQLFLVTSDSNHSQETPIELMNPVMRRWPKYLALMGFLLALLITILLLR